MPQYNPTIIAAHFDDTELQNSISKLVSFVDAQTKAIEQSFDTAVTNIKNRWGELGNMKVDLGAIASNTTNTTARVRKSNVDTIKQETQAIREQTLTLDQQAQAMQRVTAPKSARESYLAFMQGYKEQANQIGNNISALERGLQQSIERRVQELRTLLQNAESRLAGFHPQTLIAGNDTWNRAITAARQEVERLRGEIERVPQAFTKQQSIIDELRAKREAILNIMREEPRVQQQSTQATQVQVQASQRYTDEIKAQAKAIRESAEWRERGKVTINGVDILNRETDATPLKNRIALEEQLLTLQAQGSMQTRMQAQEQEAVTTAERGTYQVLQNIHEQQKAFLETTKAISGSISNFKIPLASLDDINAKLKEIRTQYSSLTLGGRISDQGNTLRQNFQDLTRQAEKLNRELGRPINFMAVKNLSEKTLDDIAYKMRQLYSYRSGLNVETQKGEILSVNKEYDRLKKKMDEVMQKNASLMDSNNALGRSWNYMKNRLAFYFTVGASASFTKQLVEVRGQYELLERSIGILIDSAQNGSRIFAELNAMAIKSPFTTMELGAAAKQLVAYDVAAKDVVDTTRRLADMAAAVGIPMERLTYALGQIKAYGYLNARDARMFANAGIPLVQELADHYTRLEGQLVSTADIYDRIKKKAIDYTDVMQVVNSMTDEGGRFFNFQEKAADTLKVRIANLTLAWNNMLNEIGKDSQSVISTGLGATKTLFENWRSIVNIIQAAALSIGVLKTVEVTYHALADKAIRRHAKGWMAFQLSMRKDLGVNIASKILNTFNSIGSSLAGLANPATLAKVAITGISIALIKAYLDYRDLQKANEEFNKSIAKNAEENIQSINKFFDDYKKKFSELGALDNVEQQKLWERTQEEIEKTVKASQQYIDVLNTISDVSKRIASGQAILEQTKIIEGEVKRLSERGVFNIGGGFANDSAAKDLEQYSNIVNKIIREYGSLENATGSLTNDITYFMGQVALESRGIFNDYQKSLIDANKELADFVSLLDKGDLSRIMGDDPSMRIANIREYASIIRDSFLSTEQGQKITSEGQALLNHAIDEWVTKTALAGRMFKQIGDDNNKYTETQQANIEANRTAWENFFSQLSESERKRLDFLIRANQTGSDDFRDLWDKATNRLKENATTAYNLIASQIAELRNTPAIVIDIVYRQREEKSLDEQINQFRKKYIEPKTPKNLSFASVDEYFDKVEENTKKYGRFIKKEGEDNVEWEKRLGETYQNNEKNIKSLTSQLQKSANMSDVDKEAKQGELNVLRQQQQVLKELERDQGFNFAQFDKSRGKGGSKKDVLGDALAEEVKLISDIQKRYREYRTMGVSATDALDKAAKEYGKTMMDNNAILQRFGLQTLTSSQIATSSYQSIRDFYQSQIKLAQAAGNTKGVEALEKAIANLNVEITKIDYKKITDGLNNELSKLKEEYELAVELDANPELGSVFADMMGLNKEELSKLPRDFDSVLKELQRRIDDKLGEGKFDLLTNLNKSKFDEWLVSAGHGLVGEDEISKALNSIREYANKVREDEAKKQKEAWDSLLQKYAEYEYKVTIIQRQAQREREIARKKNAPEEIISAIDNREKSDLARLSFEEFQKTPDWVIATGNLAGLTDKALSLLIKRIEEYKKKAKNLDPKQIKNINRALVNLRKQQREGNPFLAIANAMDEAKMRAEEIQPEIESVENKIKKLEEKKAKNGIDETTEKIEKLKEELKRLKEEQEAVGKLSATTLVDGFNSAFQAASQAADMFTNMMDALAGEKGSAAARQLNEIKDIIGQAGQGAAIGASIGGGYGAAIGAIAGFGTAFVTKIADVISGNGAINDQIERSERAVKRLEIAYNELENAVKDAIGTNVVSIQRLSIVNKELQLAELERQLALEESRKAKNKDEDKILEMKGQINSLAREIKEMNDDVLENLLGVSSVVDAVESMVGSMINALRSGDSAIEAFNGNIDDMIANLIQKFVSAKYIGPIMEEAWAKLDNIAKQRTQPYIQELELLGERKSELQSFLDRLQPGQFQDARKKWSSELEEINAQISALEESAISVGGLTESDIEQMASILEQLKLQVSPYAQILEQLLGQYLPPSTDSLSALQAGIQGITEETAGALEAYMNGVSQQVYLHTDLLTQIRDILVGYEMDVQMGTMGQVLLQLQQSYQIQTSIHNILQGVLAPAGNAFNVELIS